MTRGLGPAVMLSVLAHGGAVAAVGTLGALWLAGARPTPAPALYVDLVEPVLAASDRNAPVGALPPRPRRPDRAGQSPGITAASSREAAVSRVEPDAASFGAGGSAEPPHEPWITTPEIAGPPAAPVAPAPRATPPASAAEAVRGIASTPGPLAPSSALAPHPAAAPVVASSEAIATSSTPAPATSPRPASSEAEGTAIGSPTGRGVRRDPAPLSGAPAPGETLGSDASSPGERGGREVARFGPGDPRASSARDALIPPEYEAYVRALRQRVQDRLVYPWMAVRRGQQGTVELEVRLGAEGRLVGVEVVAGPRAETLRAAAVTAVRSAAPFPFPPGVEGRPLVIRLPVEFQLR